LLGLNKDLKELAAQGKSINVGVVGIGQMGLSLVSHLNMIPGFKVLAVADMDTSKLVDLYGALNLEQDGVFTFEGRRHTPALNADLQDFLNNKNPAEKETDKKLASAIKNNKVVFTGDFSVLANIEEIDVIVDATGSTGAGAAIALTALHANKDLVTLNVETDVTVGPILKKIAEDKDLVYTLSAGDEPAVLKELYDFVDTLGFRVICAGKGKNNPLDFSANPETIADYAAEKGSSAKIMTSFVDGTKSMVEMACLSNATGLIPDCRGMHGPAADIRDLVKVFSLKSSGGILEKEGVVDFVIGDLAPGVFLIYTTDNKEIKNTIRYLNLGSGPNYLIYKPYHMTSIETPLSIARAYFDRKPWIVPEGRLIAEVAAIAKKDLSKGEALDGIGGFTVYGAIDLYETAKDENLLPAGLAHGCILKNSRKKGEPISKDDVEFPGQSLFLQLRKLQEETIG
jgi:predicted homoserine dehydrogenase-like protein